jgi:hypothetical protein
MATIALRPRTMDATNSQVQLALADDMMHRCNSFRIGTALAVPGTQSLFPVPSHATSGVAVHILLTVPPS